MYESSMKTHELKANIEEAQRVLAEQINKNNDLCEKQVEIHENS